MNHTNDNMEAQAQTNSILLIGFSLHSVLVLKGYVDVFTMACLSDMH